MFTSLMFHIKFYFLLNVSKSAPFVHFNTCSFTTPVCIYCNLSYTAVDLFKTNKSTTPHHLPALNPSGFYDEIQAHNSAYKTLPHNSQPESTLPVTPYFRTDGISSPQSSLYSTLSPSTPLPLRGWGIPPGAHVSYGEPDSPHLYLPLIPQEN